MFRKRCLYIDPQLCASALSSKGTTEALALTLLCKLTFVDSTLRCASITRIMRIFGIGHARAKRALDVALDKGWLRRSGDNIIAASVKIRGGFNTRLSVPIRGKSAGASLRAPFSFTQMCRLLREAVLLFQISKQQDLFDTLAKTKSADTAVRKSAQKRFRRLAMRPGNVVEDGRKLSYAKMSQYMNCSKTQSKRIVRGLVGRKTISQRFNFEATDMQPQQLTRTERDNFSRYGGRGFLAFHSGAVYIQTACTYSLLKDSVRYISKQNRA